MSFNVKRVFVEKREGFNTEAVSMLMNLRDNLNLKNLTNLRILNRYDVSGIGVDDFDRAIATVLSEPNQDLVYRGEFDGGENAFAVEYLPGQYDQRADSAAQCIQVLTGRDKPVVKYARVIVPEGELSIADVDKIKRYYINPVDSREADLKKPDTLTEEYPVAQDVTEVSGFTDMTGADLDAYRKSMGLAMSTEDLRFCRDYFKSEEKRNPTVTEIRVIDTYWSDHCRHTTFSTVLEDVSFQGGSISDEIKKTYDTYLSVRNDVYRDRQKDICLMDIATIGAKELKRKGLLEDLEESDEINACSIVVNVSTDDGDEEWLVMFKNETHNHPTEIEPFGGAATCLGGAIRDPLSGRSYVYQAMRITGSGDPRRAVEETLPGKLPQRKISTEAAAGYSSYGNQIGLATGKVVEVYHPHYVAKRMEIGAVIAAAPRANVIREKPAPGDVIILVGGRTGRDGCGGATGSSKEHTEESILLCGSEVQKGNAPTERKIQRLFRNSEVSRLIKKCNDFGAGGVSVAIGELAEGLSINLDMVPKKYEGLDGTELAISESQERMAVVVREEDAEAFHRFASIENLESTVVAEVTDDKRLRMSWRGKTILDISRDFLDTNGVKQKTAVYVSEPVALGRRNDAQGSLRDMWLECLTDLNVAGQKGLVERFDASVGACTVLMPFGGRTQLTPAEGMAAKIPVKKGITDTCTLMAHGFDPYLAEKSPYHGAMYAVIHSVAKIVAMGGDYKKIRLTLQEYFEKLGKEPNRWGKPFSALLGAYRVQHELGIPAIGGKDSMSGTFKDMNVPPSLISFAVTSTGVKHVLSPEFKKSGSKVLLIKINTDANMIPDFDDMKKKYDAVHEAILSGKVYSAHTVGYGGMAEAVSKMSFGNRTGFTANVDAGLSNKDWFEPIYGSLLVETDDLSIFDGTDVIVIGETTSEEKITVNGCSITIDELTKAWLKPLDSIYPVKEDSDGKIEECRYTKGRKFKFAGSIVKPRVFIPAFPGTNCEYDTKRAFDRAGAAADIFVFRNMTTAAIEDSVKEMEQMIKQSQIIAFPGGFSAGDEPEGSGKFIAAVFRNERLKYAVTDLLKNRDGLIIGICNGFQALIKLGLVPFGEIVDIRDDYPTLTYNKISRHISTFAMTKVTSNLSPWLSGCEVGDIHFMPLSHGEGRFVASQEWIDRLMEMGQIATQYVDFDGNPTYDGMYNPNGSVYAIEGITSPDGRVLGKMGHSERRDRDTYLNIPGNKDQLIFESGVKYFK